MCLSNSFLFFVLHYFHCCNTFMKRVSQNLRKPYNSSDNVCPCTDIWVKVTANRSDTFFILTICKTKYQFNRRQRGICLNLAWKSDLLSIHKVLFWNWYWRNLNFKLRFIKSMWIVCPKMKKNHRKIVLEVHELTVTASFYYFNKDLYMPFKESANKRNTSLKHSFLKSSLSISQKCSSVTHVCKSLHRLTELELIMFTS